MNKNIMSLQKDYRQIKLKQYKYEEKAQNAVSDILKVLKNNLKQLNEDHSLFQKVFNDFKSNLKNKMKVWEDDDFDVDPDFDSKLAHILSCVS